MPLAKPARIVHSPGYQIATLTLCLYALGVLAAEAVGHLQPATAAILEYVDFLVCGVFFIDFLLSLAAAENRLHYLRTWGWLDLLSSIPILDVVRWGRVARVVRVFRVLRGLRATRTVATLLARHRAENTMLMASVLALMIVTFCSIAILHFETDPQSNIKTADDALWWAFATVTTVGYGDRYPVTAEGRIVAVLLMSAGVGLFGVFSGFLAAWFIGPEKKGVDQELVSLREEVRALRKAIEEKG